MAPPTTNAHTHTHPALDDFAKSYYWIINVASFPRILLGVNILLFPTEKGTGKGWGVLLAPPSIV